MGECSDPVSDDLDVREPASGAMRHGVFSTAFIPPTTHIAQKYNTGFYTAEFCTTRASIAGWKKTPAAMSEAEDKAIIFIYFHDFSCFT